MSLTPSGCYSLPNPPTTLFDSQSMMPEMCSQMCGSGQLALIAPTAASIWNFNCICVSQVPSSLASIPCDVKCPGAPIPTQAPPCGGSKNGQIAWSAYGSLPMPAPVAPVTKEAVVTVASVVVPARTSNEAQPVLASQSLSAFQTEQLPSPPQQPEQAVAVDSKSKSSPSIASNPNEVAVSGALAASIITSSTLVASVTSWNIQATSVTSSVRPLTASVVASNPPDNVSTASITTSEHANGPAIANITSQPFSGPASADSPRTGPTAALLITCGAVGAAVVLAVAVIDRTRHSRDRRMHAAPPLLSYASYSDDRSLLDMYGGTATPASNDACSLLDVNDNEAGAMPAPPPLALLADSHASAKSMHAPMMASTLDSEFRRAPLHQRDAATLSTVSPGRTATLGAMSERLKVSLGMGDNLRKSGSVLSEEGNSVGSWQSKEGGVVSMASFTDSYGSTPGIHSFAPLAKLKRCSLDHSVTPSSLFMRGFEKNAMLMRETKSNDELLRIRKDPLFTSSKLV